MKTFSGRNPSQDDCEIAGFADLLVSRNVTRYLEIGARHGDTFHYIMSHLPAGSVGVAVDFPGALWGTDKSRNYLVAAVQDLNLRGYACEAIFGDSKSEGVRVAIAQFGKFDAALIDGDHTYAGVKADWDNYNHSSTLIAFHDIVGTGQFEKVSHNMVDVPQLWSELELLHDHCVFVSPNSKMGIGVLWK